MEEQEWCLLTRERNSRYERSVWVPLFVDEHKESGVFPEAGYFDDYHGVGVMLVDEVDREDLTHLDWCCVRPQRFSPGFDSDGFYSCKYYFGQIHGEHLVYPVGADKDDGCKSVLIEPDLIIGLELEPQGENWICRAEDGVVVIRQFRQAGLISRVEIMSEFLKDFLAARNMGLVVVTCRERKMIVESKPIFTLPDREKGDGWFWDGGISEINEHGDYFGNTWQVSIIGRTDIDSRDDAPTAEYSRDNEATTHRKFTTTPGVMLRYCLAGNLTKNEWVSPAALSTRVREDESTDEYSFISDSSGNHMTASELINEPKWRWITFSPDAIRVLMVDGRVKLQWSTKFTGRLRFLDDSSLPFGMNSKGLVNVFSKDVAEMPGHRQRYFSGMSVAPDGGVCDELIQAQMVSNPASSFAPEAKIRQVRAKLDNAFKSRFNEELFQAQQDLEAIFRRSNRFMPASVAQLYDLAKDLRQLFVESIDLGQLRKLSSTQPKETGSIKRLQFILEQQGKDGYALTSALVGINTLRQASAHIASSSVDKDFKLVGVDINEPLPICGLNMLDSVVESVEAIATALEVHIDQT